MNWTRVGSGNVSGARVSYTSASRKLHGIVPEWYNTSWHSQAYITGRLERLFTDVHYTVVPDGMQDLVAARVP